jgi:hypothetical protein
VLVQSHLYMKFGGVPIIMPNFSTLVPHVGLNYVCMLTEQLRDSKHSRFEGSICSHKEGRQNMYCQCVIDVGFPVKLS